VDALKKSSNAIASSDAGSSPAVDVCATARPPGATWPSITFARNPGDGPISAAAIPGCSWSRLAMATR
jgi:hypothetical protein